MASLLRLVEFGLCIDFGRKSNLRGVGDRSLWRVRLVFWRFEMVKEDRRWGMGFDTCNQVTGRVKQMLPLT